MLRKIWKRLRKQPKVNIKKCKWCDKLPEGPWIYCQDQECIRRSIADLVNHSFKEKISISPIEQVKTLMLIAGKQSLCPLCREEISNSISSSCDNCKTAYHNDCLLELTNSRCSTVGCNRFVRT